MIGLIFFVVRNIFLFIAVVRKINTVDLIVVLFRLKLKSDRKLQAWCYD